MPGRLTNKIAIVTGASSGIGRATSLALHREGATVVCSDLREASRNAESSEAEIGTHDLIVKEGGKAIFVQADVSKSADVEALVSKAIEQFGRLDIMVNNAGVALENAGPKPIYEFDEAMWDATMNVNAKGVFLGCKYAAAQMVKQEPHACGDRGWIVNLASILGLGGSPSIVSYVASKHAVMGITKTAAWDCAPHRIHVNAICPGYTDTLMAANPINHPELGPRLRGMHPFRGFGEPEDIAKAIVFLASEDNSWITGIGLPVDGGYSSM